MKTEEGTEIARQDSLNESAISGMLSRAIDKLGGEGAQAVVDAVKQLVELRHAEEDRHAKREFAEAFAEYGRRRASVPRNRERKHATDGGIEKSDRYADLAAIEQTQGPLLRELGFSWYWETIEEGQDVSQKCVLLHRGGHSISTVARVPLDPGTRRMNTVQRKGSSYRYAQRYGLIQILGLTEADPELDTDGEDLTSINDKQLETIENLIAQTGTDKGKFLAWIGAATLAEVPAARYNEAVAMLRRKGEKK